MRGTTPELHQLARWLLAQESGNQADRDNVLEAAEEAFGKLRRLLADLLGSAGFDAILLRALDLSRRQIPFMETIQPGQRGEGCLKGVKEAARGQDPGQVADGLATLLAQFLWVLTTLLGEDLAMREVATIWPEARLGDSGSGSVEISR